MDIGPIEADFMVKIGDFRHYFNAKSLIGAKRIATGIYWCSTALGRKLWKRWHFPSCDFIHLYDNRGLSPVVYNYCCLPVSAGWLN